MGFIEACQQWAERVKYNFKEGYQVGSMTPKGQPAMYRPMDGVAQTTRYDLIAEKDLLKKVCIPESDETYPHYKYIKIQRFQRRWESFVNFIYSPLELISWIMIFLFQAGKFLLYTCLYSGLKNIVIPFVLSALTVSIVSVFQSMWLTACQFYHYVRGLKAHERDNNHQATCWDSCAVVIPVNAPPSRWRILPAMFFFLIGLVWGIVRGVVRTLLMLLSEVDEVLENFYGWKDSAHKIPKKFFGKMLPQLFTALGVWFESIANHLNNIWRLISDHIFVKNVIDGGFNSLPHIMLGIMEIGVVRPLGIALAFFTDILVFWDVEFSRTKAHTAVYLAAWHKMWEDKTSRRQQSTREHGTQGRSEVPRDTAPNGSSGSGTIKTDRKSSGTASDNSSGNVSSHVSSEGGRESPEGERQSAEEGQQAPQGESAQPKAVDAAASPAQEGVVVNPMASLLMAVGTPEPKPRNISMVSVELNPPSSGGASGVSTQDGQGKRNLKEHPSVRIIPPSGNNGEQTGMISDGLSPQRFCIEALHNVSPHQQRRPSPSYHWDPERQVGTLTHYSENYEESSDEGSPRIPGTPVGDAGTGFGERGNEGGDEGRSNSLSLSLNG